MKPDQPVTTPEERPTRGRFFRITYSNAAPDDEPKLFQGRDGIAFAELSAPLPSLGYDYATTIHFYPDDARKLTEFPAFTPADLLVLPTRPPLTDREARFPPRKIIRDSRNELEKLIFKQLFRYFEYCTRKHVELTPEAIKTLSNDAKKWAFLEFFEHSGETHPFGQARIRKHVTTSKKPHKDINSTVAFLVRGSHLPGVGGTPDVPCGFLASFGMDGYSTLIWNRIVRLQHPEWLSTTGFVMAELVFKQPIPSRPLTPEFATDPKFIEVNVLTQSTGNP